MGIRNAVVTGLLLLLSPLPVAAQDFPNKPIRLIVPFPPAAPMTSSRAWSASACRKSSSSRW
jgi:hypothetical protein